MHKSIIPECYVDTCLVNVLLKTSPKNPVNHGKGKSTVAGKMKIEFADEFCLAVIDKDENDRGNKFLGDFFTVNETINEYSVLFKHENAHHYVIQLCPEVETWICNVTKCLGIDLESEKFKLSNTPQGLSKFTKNIFSAGDQRLINLFKEINKTSEDANFEPVLKLKFWLEYLPVKTYSADINELMK